MAKSKDQAPVTESDSADTVSTDELPEGAVELSNGDVIDNDDNGNTRRTHPNGSVYVTDGLDVTDTVVALDALGYIK